MFSRALSPNFSPPACSATQAELFESRDALAPCSPAEGECVDTSDPYLVQLHWLLLSRIADLAEPEAPLGMKLDILQWVLTDPAHDDGPFSFVHCVNLVTRNRASPLPYLGVVDPEEIRGYVLSNMRRWLTETVKRYPPWVQASLWRNPDWVARRLANDDQWVNRELKRQEMLGPQLFDPRH